MIYTDNKQLKAIALQIYNYRGKKIRIDTTFGDVYLLSNYWDDGSKNYAVLLNYQTGKKEIFPTINPLVDTRDSKEIAIAPKQAIVEHSIFRGKDMGIRFIVRKDEYENFLKRYEIESPKAQANNLTLAEKIVLISHQKFKSNCRVNSAWRDTGMPPEIFLQTKEKMVGDGKWFKSKSLNTEGKNLAIALDGDWHKLKWSKNA